jgi:hypothetical protein
MVLGSYVSFLINKDLYPIRRTSIDITLSIEELDTLVQAVELLALDSHHYTKINAAKPHSQFHFRDLDEAELKVFHIKELGVISHKRCTDAFGFQSQIRRYRDDTLSPVLESHRRHMETQALK